MITRPPRAPPAEPVADWVIVGVGLVAGGRGVAGVDGGLAVGVVGGLAAVGGDAGRRCWRPAARPASLSESLPAAMLPPRVGQGHAAVDDVGVLVDHQDAAEQAVGRAVGGLVDRGVRLVADRADALPVEIGGGAVAARCRRCRCWTPGRGRSCRSGCRRRVLFELLPMAMLPPVLATADADVRDVGLLVDHLDGAEVARDRDGLGAVGAGLVADGGGVTGVRRRRCRRSRCRRRSGRPRGRPTRPGG